MRFESRGSSALPGRGGGPRSGFASAPAVPALRRPEPGFGPGPAWPLRGGESADGERLPGRGGAFARTGLRSASLRDSAGFVTAAPSRAGNAFAAGGASATGVGGLCLFLCQCARIARDDGVVDATAGAGLPSLSVVRAIVHLLQYPRTGGILARIREIV